jgi:hypothetical protein
MPGVRLPSLRAEQYEVRAFIAHIGRCRVHPQVRASNIASITEVGAGNFRRRSSSHMDPVWNLIAIHPSLIRVDSTDKVD